MGSQTSRVILVTDPGSRIPVIIEPSGQRAILSGDNLFAPRLDFVETPELIRPGDRVVTSGDGGVFPSDLLIGRVTLDNNGLLRARLSADLGRLEYLRVLRAPQAPEVQEDGDLVGGVLDNSIEQSEGAEDGT